VPPATQGFDLVFNHAKVLMSINSSADVKQVIAHHFGRAAIQYQAQAQMQKDCAHQLWQCLPPSVQLPPGPILEVGCGTGFITQHLIDRFPDRPLEITDLSLEMLQFCQAQLPATQQQRVHFHVMDGEAIAPLQPCALIVSGFVIQWFTDPIQTLRHWLTHLVPGGVLLLSFPTYQSFPEWRQICLELNLPFTANPLPNPHQILDEVGSVHLVEAIEQEIELSFGDAVAFFRSLKAIGAGVNRTGKQLSPQQMRHLIQYWNQKARLDPANDAIKIHFQIWLGALQC
jgi:malonyl-CoA O-methyltransferase